MEDTNTRTFKRLILTTILFFTMFLFFVNFAFAFNITLVTPSYINRTIPTIINFTINNTDNVNITSIIFTLPMEARFYLGNGTNADNTLFTNSTATQGPPQITLNWTNTTTLIPINGTRSFWFNATLMNLGSTLFTNITLQADHLAGPPTTNSYNYIVYFGFSAYVKNETGGNESNVNISIYRFALGSNGPPTETLEANVLSGSDGSFTFASINGSSQLYTLKMYRYGPNTNCVSANTTCNATKVGSILPAFPAMMYYPTTADLPLFEFMRPPSLNGTTFYLNPAATLRLSAHNNSNGQNFGYEVVDQGIGFPLASNIMSAVSTVDVVVPISRNYTVMFARTPGFGGSGFGFYPECNGNFMNDSACPSPPISNSTLGTLTAGQILVVNQSLNVGNYRLTGCINTGGNNNTLVNITAISLKMMPWTGFVPPMRADRGDIDITANINYTNTLCTSNGNFAFYNISVMGAASGINYFIEMYAKNASNEAGNPGNANNLAVFQNISITNNTNYNLTLYKLASGYRSSGVSVNTSQIKINILNSTGGAITNNMNANVKIKFGAATGVGTVNYIIESMTNGVFYMPILNNSAWAKLMVFANDAPPKEITINLSASEQNITLVSMSDGSGVGMKRINATGGMQMINSTELDVSRPMNLRFLRNTGAWGSGCNVLNPDESCSLTSVNAKRFNPLTALIAGKVNMEMKMTTTNVTLTFVNFDMFSAKQPPLDSVINDQASSGASSTNQVWQFGSFAPANAYDYVIITMPYDSSAINDSASMILSAPIMYDENWNVVWNITRGDTSANMSDDVIDYNATLYRNYTLSGGQICSKTDSYLNVTPCFVNTTVHLIYMKIPHFSGVGPAVGGTAPGVAAAASTSTSTSTSSTSSAGGVAVAGIVSASNTWATMSAGQVYKYIISKSDLAIDSVVVTPSETLASVKLVVKQLVEKPVDITTVPAGTVFKYTSVEKTNILNSQILNAKITFSVDKSWVDGKGGKENIVMLRYNNNLWEKLATTYTGSVGDKYQFEAITPGFSYFAITYQTPEQKAEQKAPEVVKTPSVSETPVAANQPENLLEQKEAKKTNWMPIVIVLVCVLLVALVAYFVHKKKQDEDLGAYRYKPNRR